MLSKTVSAHAATCADRNPIGILEKLLKIVWYWESAEVVCTLQLHKTAVGITEELVLCLVEVMDLQRGLDNSRRFSPAHFCIVD